jgi:hypothetical protein
LSNTRLGTTDLHDVALELELEEALGRIDSGQEGGCWVSSNRCILRAENSNDQTSQFDEHARPVLQHLGVAGPPRLWHQAYVCG